MFAGARAPTSGLNKQELYVIHITCPVHRLFSSVVERLPSKEKAWVRYPQEPFCSGLRYFNRQTQCSLQPSERFAE